MRKRFNEPEIIAMLQELGSGKPATELAREHGVHANTIRMWRDKYAGVKTTDVARMRHLEAENAQMHRIIARQTIELDAMRDFVSKSGRGRMSKKRAD